MVLRRQGCGGARTAGQATTAAAPASTPAQLRRLRPPPAPAASSAATGTRALHHGDGRRQRLPPAVTDGDAAGPRLDTCSAHSLAPQATSPRHTDSITTALPTR
ncbi:hypothetical protein ANN_09782 [Periplaneta americana]|uniref:Uncharacterized protein n=1 Tax=Periplaneta americana TaxID=6978 RepID=A0ABQ8TM85_PERAM|nr:hypothetical protein ANN_09782 [Periplaneta americana]